MRKYKCYMCDGIVDIVILHSDKGDELMCPRCGAVECGFSELDVKEVSPDDL